LKRLAKLQATQTPTPMPPTDAQKNVPEQKVVSSSSTMTTTTTAAIADQSKQKSGSASSLASAAQVQEQWCHRSVMDVWKVALTEEEAHANGCVLLQDLASEMQAEGRK
jgi:hypothetical protein